MFFWGRNNPGAYDLRLGFLKKNNQCSASFVCLWNRWSDCEETVTTFTLHTERHGSAIYCEFPGRWHPLTVHIWFENPRRGTETNPVWNEWQLLQELSCLSFFIHVVFSFEEVTNKAIFAWIKNTFVSTRVWHVDIPLESRRVVL